MKAKKCRMPVDRNVIKEEEEEEEEVYSIRNKTINKLFCLFVWFCCCFGLWFGLLPLTL